MRLTKKLFGFLNRVFDKDPVQFLAIRLQYKGGMTWTIADAVLKTTVTGGPGQNLSINLSNYTIGQLVTYLAAQPGYSIPYADTSELSLLSSRVLLDGTGDIAMSNGDHLYGYTNALHAYMEAQSVELQAAEAQIVEALKQMSTVTASAEWLDELGGYYGVPRLSGEIDLQYGPRIIAEVLRPRGNNVAMEAAITVFTGQPTKVTDVTLYGATFPTYGSGIFYNGVYQHNADAKPIYGLFDVDYGYDLLNGGDVTAFKQVVVDLINRLRDAGTHLRSLSLKSSAVIDSFTAPTDGAASQQVTTGYNVSDSLTAPTEAFAAAGTVQAMSDSLTAPSDAETVTISYNYRYNGVRSYNGIASYNSGANVVETL